MVGSLQFDITADNVLCFSYYRKKKDSWSRVLFRDDTPDFVDSVYKKALFFLQNGKIQKIKQYKKGNKDHIFQVSFGHTEVVLHHYDKFLERSDFLPVKDVLEDASIRFQEWTYVAKERTKAIPLPRKGVLQDIILASTVTFSTAILATSLRLMGISSFKEAVVRTMNSLTEARPFLTVEEVEVPVSEESILIDSKSYVLEQQENLFQSVSLSNPVQKSIALPDFLVNRDWFFEIVDFSNANDVISFACHMYHMDRSQVEQAILTHQDTIEEAVNQNVGIMRAVAKDYWNLENMDRTPVIATLSQEKREQLILKIADMYGITDTETRATLLAIHRLEADWGNSDLCQNSNNLGGVKVGGSYVVYPTQASGAEALVRTVLNLKMRAIENGVYEEEKSLAHNIGRYYCTELVPGATSSWESVVEGMTSQVLEENIDHVEVEKNKSFSL